MRYYTLNEILRVHKSYMEYWMSDAEGIYPEITMLDLTKVALDGGELSKPLALYDLEALYGININNSFNEPPSYFPEFEGMNLNDPENPERYPIVCPFTWKTEGQPDIVVITERPTFFHAWKEDHEFEVLVLPKITRIDKQVLREYETDYGVRANPEVYGNIYEDIPQKQE